MTEKRIKTIAIILLSLSMVAMCTLAYLIGFEIGKQKGTSYMLVLTIEPAPDEVEPKASKDEGNI